MKVKQNIKECKIIIILIKNLFKKSFEKIQPNYAVIYSSWNIKIVSQG